MFSLISQQWQENMLGTRSQLVLCGLLYSDAVLYRVVKIGVEERTRTTTKSESSHSRKRVKVRPILQSYYTAPFFPLLSGPNTYCTPESDICPVLSVCADIK